ncbi:hypothetical protein N9M03_00720 [bacterium]|nr:hypothetical protein [bacterium]
MPVDVQKLLNWIDNSHNLNDFEAIQITIMDGGENPAAKFPQQQMAVFSKEESRRNVLSSAMSGLIKQIGRFEASEKPPVEELPRIIVADIDNINRIVDVAEWSDTEDWNFSSDNYWIVAKRLTSPLLGPSEKRFPWLALIPRNGTKNSPAVRFLQPVDLSAMDMNKLSKQNVEVLEGLEAYLAEIGNTDVAYHVAKIYFGPLKSQ